MPKQPDVPRCKACAEAFLVIGERGSVIASKIKCGFDLETHDAGHRCDRFKPTSQAAQTQPAEAAP